MAKKVTKITEVRHEIENPLALDFDIPGYAFRWVDAEKRSAAHKWQHWRAVERDSEIGLLVKDYIDSAPDKYQGPNMTSNYFHRGSQLILAWATAEDSAAYKKAMAEKAANQLRKVSGADGVDMQQVFVPSNQRK